MEQGGRILDVLKFLPEEDLSPLEQAAAEIDAVVNQEEAELWQG